MGRKKIKIRPIKDDRNRAVTFLKRKNGLFKKAFELAVLCRAEVAVIVFAGNKKLYEFASTDMKDVLYRYTQAPEPYEHRGPEDFLSKEDGDSDDLDDMGLEADYHSTRPMSHTPQPQSTPHFSHHMDHHRRTSDDSIVSSRRHSLHPGPSTPQILPHRTPPIHSRQHSIHMNTPPQQFQVPMVPGHGSPQPAISAVRGGMMMQDGMGLGIGMNTPQPYGMQYNPYGQQQVYVNSQENTSRRPSNPSNYYPQNQQNHYQPSPPLPPINQPQQQQPPQQPQVTEIKSTKGRMKSIHTPVSSRASSLAAHFDTSRSQYDRPPPPPARSHSVDSGAPQQVMSNLPLSNSPPPITTTTPGSTSSVPGQRPKLSLHIPDDEDPNQQAEESGASATPVTASPETNRDSSDVKREHGDDRREGNEQQFFLPPPTTSSLLPNGRLPGPALGAFDSSNSGGTPLSALPSRYAGDMLPSPSTFYPEFYASLPSAGTSAIRGGFGGIMNGTPVVSRADEGSTFGYGYTGSGEKRRGEELAGAPKRARS